MASVPTGRASVVAGHGGLEPMSSRDRDLGRYYEHLLILLRHRAGGAVPSADVRAAALRCSAAIREALAMELPGILRDLGVAGAEIVPDGPLDGGAVWEPAVRTLISGEPLTASQRDCPGRAARCGWGVGHADLEPCGRCRASNCD
jgi:hypothetical protein